MMRVAILFGGPSCEHSVSLLSAKNVIEALPRDRYEPILIGIDREGKWHLLDETCYLKNPDNPKDISLALPGKPINFLPCHGRWKWIVNEKDLDIDVVFPVLHGEKGEDGAIQGFLELMNIPYVGSAVLGSSLGMDKERSKRIVKEIGINVGKWKGFGIHQRNKINPPEIIKELGLPLFVKPTCRGSSVGVSKVESEKALMPAVDFAFRYDNRILIEKAVIGREIECSVLGDINPKPSVPGEIKPKRSFYSYEAKYLDEEGALLIAPAPLSSEETAAVQDLSVKIFLALDGSGMARIDFFYSMEGEWIFNEINTIPGFTKISMYPRLLALSGIPYPVLLTELIDLAVERWKRVKAVCPEQ